MGAVKRELDQLLADLRAAPPVIKWKAMALTFGAVVVALSLGFELGALLVG